MYSILKGHHYTKVTNTLISNPKIRRYPLIIERSMQQEALLIVRAAVSSTGQAIIRFVDPTTVGGASFLLVTAVVGAVGGGYGYVSYVTNNEQRQADNFSQRHDNLTNLLLRSEQRGGDLFTASIDLNGKYRQLKRELESSHPVLRDTNLDHLTPRSFRDLPSYQLAVRASNSGNPFFRATKSDPTLIAKEESVYQMSVVRNQRDQAILGLREELV